MADRIPDEVIRSAADMILAAAGSGLRHHTLATNRARILETTRNVLQAVADHAEDGVRAANTWPFKRTGEK